MHVPFVMNADSTVYYDLYPCAYLLVVSNDDISVPKSNFRQDLLVQSALQYA